MRSTSRPTSPRAGDGPTIPTQRAPLRQLDLVSAGPVLEREPAAGRLRQGLRLMVLLAVGAAGAGWGLQQPGQEREPVLVSVQKAVTQQPSWGTLAADLPGVSCGALVDWAVLGTGLVGIERTLPCGDGSEVRARITVDDEQQLRITLEADAAALESASDHLPR